MFNFSSAADMVSVTESMEVGDMVPTPGMPPHLQMLHKYRIQQYVLPFLSAIGLAGNITCMLVCGRNIRKAPTTLFIVALCVVDSIFLLFGPPLNFLRDLFGVEIMPVLGCNFVLAVIDTSAILSTLTLLVLNCERTYALYKPHGWKTMKIWQACLVLALLVFVTFVVNWPYFGGMELVIGFTGPKVFDSCKGKTDTIQFYYKAVYPWIQSSLYSYLPTVAICICCGFMIYKARMIRASVHPLGVPEAGAAARRELLRITKMICVVSAVFVCLTVPAQILILTLRLSPPSAKQVPQPKIVGILIYAVQQVLIILAICNHGVNVLVYAAVSKKFRQDVKQLYKCTFRRSTQTTSTDR